MKFIFLKKFLVAQSLVVTAFFFLNGISAEAQKPSQVSEEKTERKEPATESNKTRRVANEVKLARGILQTAEAEAGSFEPPARSVLCYQTARGYLTFDKREARELLMRCFNMTQQIEGDDETKQQVQGWIVAELLKFGPETAEELLPRVQGRARSSVRSSLIHAYVKDKNFDRAITMVNEVRPGEESFPYEAVAKLMMSLPEEMNGSRTTLFSQTLADYRQRPAEKNTIRSEDMATFVVRFARMMPSNLALEAIDEVLKKAKEESEGSRNLQIVISNEDKSAAFRSTYEYRLFQVLPALRALDSSRAESLLRDNQTSKMLLTRYPDGMQSITPSYQGVPSEADSGGTKLSMSISSGDGTSDRGAEQERRIQVRRRVDEVVQGAEKNPRQAIAQAMSLPNGEAARGNFRCEALEGIGRALAKKNPQFAKSAVDELVKQALGPDMHYQGKQQYLSSAIKLYLEMNENEAALKTIKEGAAVAAKLHEQDENASAPNEAIRPYWPSAALWRTFIQFAGKISPAAALETVRDIEDAEIQLYEKITLANSWLGVPYGTVVVREKRKSGANSTMISSEN